jgi:hypothetical protein
MKISIFPDVKPLPTKKEKPFEASRTGVVRDKKTGEVIKEYLPEVVEVFTEEDLIKVVTSYAWSPSVFKGPRLQENFLSADFIALDIDSGLTIEEAEKRCIELNLTVLCVPSTSHKPEAHRFRLIFPTLRSITSNEEYQATASKLFEKFPEADPKCVTDSARFFFGSTTNDGFWQEGDFLPVELPTPPKAKTKGYVHSGERVPVDMSIEQIVLDLYGEKRDTIPEAVAHFISNAHTGLPGTWTTDLNSCIYTLSLQGIDEDTIWDLVEFLAPRGELTKRDVDTVERAIKDGVKAREEDVDREENG